jgi:hypothetical protein
MNQTLNIVVIVDPGSGSPPVRGQYWPVGAWRKAFFSPAAF